MIYLMLALCEARFRSQGVEHVVEAVSQLESSKLISNETCEQRTELAVTDRNLRNARYPHVDVVQDAEAKIR